MRPRPHVLPVIVLAQFAGTSLWFVGNSVAPDLADRWPHIDAAVGWLTSAVQLGFILGTAVIALTGLADRFRAHHVFAIACSLGALANASMLVAPDRFTVIVLGRVLTGLCLAGIYPVGMKLAASWYDRDLGRAIGLLVGALVLGTAFPHLLQTTALPWRPVVLASSALACVGALVVGLGVPEGPHVARGRRFEMRRAFAVFSVPGFRRAAIGYFGHMWELYALWAFVPWAVGRILGDQAGAAGLAWWSFGIIGIGALGCIGGGFLSGRRGSAKVAIVQLVVSGTCCLLSPLLLDAAPTWAALALLLVWGLTVVGDSPQFSALGARTAPPDLVGTALTLMTTIGFAITIASISLVSFLVEATEGSWSLLVLALGPLVGVWAMAPMWIDDPTAPTAPTRSDTSWKKQRS